MSTTAAMAISAGAMPIVSDDFWASASASVSWRTRIASALATSVSRIRDPDSAASSTAAASSRSGDDVGPSTEIVEGVPELAAPRLGRPQRRRQLVELRPVAGPGGDHQRVLDARPAGQRDADDVDEDGDRLGPRLARRPGPGPHLELGVDPSDGAERQGARRAPAGPGPDVEEGQRDDRGDQRRAW